MEFNNKYAILRLNKIKSKSKLKAAGLHNSRKQFAPNADPNGSCKLLAGSNDPLKRLNAIIDKYELKPRKNSVLATEFMLGFSPEMKGKVDINEWAKANIDFINSKFPKGAILSAHLHLDETTPHIQLTVAPLVMKEFKKQIGAKEWETQKGFRFAARDYFGGKAKMIQWQDDYAAAMEKFGLERGIRNSKAHHKTMQEMYGESKQTLDDIEQLVNQEIEANKAGNEPMIGKKNFWKTAYFKVLEIAKDVLKFQHSEMKFTKKTKAELVKTKSALGKAEDALSRILKASGMSLDNTVAELNRSREAAQREAEELYKDPCHSVQPQAQPVEKGIKSPTRDRVSPADSELTR